MRKLIPVVLILLSMVAGGMAYPSLPELVTLRWGDGVSEPLPRLLVAFVVPLAALAVWLLLRGLASPAGERVGRRLFPAWFVSERTGATAVSRFGPTYDTIILGTVSLLLLFHVAILAAALGAPSWTARAVTIVLGAGMMAVGNIMPRTRPNWVAGLRTRRTLADPDVWRRTHRWFGALLVVSGVAVVMASFVGAPVALAVAVAGALVSAIVATIAGARGSDSGPSGLPAVLVVVFMTSAMPLSAQGPDTTPGARGFAACAHVDDDRESAREVIVDSLEAVRASRGGSRAQTARRTASALAPRRITGPRTGSDHSLSTDTPAGRAST